MTMIQVKQINTYYTQMGEGYDVVCLVGWGQDTRMFEPTQTYLSKHFRVTCVDYPGFGQTELMKEAWSVDDYVSWLNDFLTQLNISHPIIIAHSFGARVALKYNLLYPIRKLVFTGAAGIRPKRKLSTQIRIRVYKILKRLVQLPGLSMFQEDFQ
mgnify:FL=1